MILKHSMKTDIRKITDAYDFSKILVKSYVDEYHSRIAVSNEGWQFCQDCV